MVNLTLTCYSVLNNLSFLFSFFPTTMGFGLNIGIDRQTGKRAD